MKHFHLMLACCAMTFVAPTDAADIVLLSNGKSDYQIVVPDESASPAIEECLSQIGRLVQTAFVANGADVSVVREAQRKASMPAIFLGDTRFARANGIDVSKLQGWGYFQQAFGRDIVIAGRDHSSPDRSGATSARRPVWDRVATAKGVADFLREYAGVRFLYPDVNAYQSVAALAKVDLIQSPAIEFLKTPSIAIPADLKVRKIPLLNYNTSHPAGGGFYDIANNRFPRVDEVFGGHTYERAVPVEKYSESHPEYFALVGGKRLNNEPGRSQYCISNPDVQELIYQDLINWLDRGYQLVDLGQPDGFRPCQCEMCSKLYDTGNDWSEKLWLFHRDLAERVMKARPERQVTMMSYIQTAAPPKSFKKFPANTVILLTGTNEDDIAPWRNVEVPGGFSSYVYNWCPNLGTRYTPMRTPRYVEAQAKRLAANHFRSIYRDGPGGLYGLEGPVYYTMGRMYDAPEQLQAKQLVHEFCDAAFGRSAGSMLQFYDQLYHAIELYSEFLGTRNPAWTYQTIYGQSRKFLTDPVQFVAFFYTPTLLESLENQLSAAERNADNKKVKMRLALVRREFNFLKGMAKVAHLYHAYQIQPDLVARDRLLDAIDARNAEVDSYFDARGHVKPFGTWQHPMFPPLGHDARHLKLEYDGYQEPYANSVYNWNTKSMRSAPLPGAKRWHSQVTTESVTFDSSNWTKAEEIKLEGLASSAGIPNPTTIRSLFDVTHIYFRFTGHLPASRIEHVNRGDATAEEAVSVYLSPSGNRDVAYRFTVGPTRESKFDAITGIISDPIDPRYGKFDHDWNGDWKYEIRLNPDRNEWSGLLAIPYTTLGVKGPSVGGFWRGNVSRSHLTEQKAIERSVWSVTPGSKTSDNLNDFGEILFRSADQSQSKDAAQSPLEALRKDLYSKSFETLAEWSKRTNPLSVGEWLFRKDPIELGLKQNWFAVDTSTKDWTAISVPSFWAENDSIGKFEGYGWYRTTFDVPESLEGRGLQILFGSVDEQAWVYVNGRLVREHSTKSEGKSINELWESPFVADVPSDLVQRGKSNVLVVRVHNSIANGGIWRPVVIVPAASK